VLGRITGALSMNLGVKGVGEPICGKKITGKLNWC
jgi:hypothetical protein